MCCMTNNGMRGGVETANTAIDIRVLYRNIIIHIYDTTLFTVL